mmetsp:Transcript_12/g.33  ORF Transcript_12/g.33 Transcript_12/m.33 type:complete len:153 (+) Transcript_12:84-542(+)
MSSAKSHFEQNLETKTGLSRTQQAEMSKEEREALREKLKYFEAMVDPDDPEQMAVLLEMREHTREVERLTGVWGERGKPGVQRDWNEYNPQALAERPKDNAEFRQYKEHVQREKEMAKEARLEAAERRQTQEQKDQERKKNREEFMRSRGLL